jgi:RHS repeat-associated protein
VADATGTTVWRWDQAEPFGNNPADEDPDGNSVAFDLPLRLPGQRFDAETALHYNYFRDYDPSLGRYGKSDPIGLDGGMNTYVYGDDRPVERSDFLGLFSWAHHVHMTQNAARQECPRLLPGLPIMVAQVDYKKGSQDPIYAFIHAMRDGTAGQDAWQAHMQTINYIDAELQKCTEDGLANALHAEQDRHSRPHVGSQAWTGSASGRRRHLWGDTFGAAGGYFGQAEFATVQTLRRFNIMCPCVCK